MIVNRRFCFKCGAEIFESMGFVLVGDLFYRERTIVRELCGVCGIKALDLTKDQIKELLNLRCTMCDDEKPLKMEG